MSSKSRPQLLVNDATDDPNSQFAPTIATPNEDNPWRLKALLSLDGGGVWGLSSLILLKYLMSCIEVEEKRTNKNTSGSAYSPLFDSAFPKESSTPGSAERTSYKYLPCHYFDFIGGTSTGGLTAIMLGRLRMSVDEAIEEYKELCKDVFEKPSSKIERLLSRYDAVHRRQKLKDHFESMASRHLECPPSEGPSKFESDRERCRTIVCTLKMDEVSGIKEPFLFRSYGPSKDCKKESKDSNTGLEQNALISHNLNIHEVTQVTTAAPSYLEPVCFQGCRYYDAVVDFHNPTWTLLKEVSAVATESHEHLDSLLSIGAGNPSIQKFEGGSRQTAPLLDSSTHSERVHQNLHKESERQGFRYYRLNVYGGLENVRLDEWKPKQSGKMTFEKIETQTHYVIWQGDGAECKELAYALVKRRAERSKTMQWEAFASGIRYKCPLSECSKGDVVFGHRNALMDHLRMQHDKPPPDTEHYREMKALLDQGRTYYD